MGPAGFGVVPLCKQIISPFLLVDGHSFTSIGRGEKRGGKWEEAFAFKSNLLLALISFLRSRGGAAVAAGPPMQPGGRHYPLIRGGLWSKRAGD